MQKHVLIVFVMGLVCFLSACGKKQNNFSPSENNNLHSGAHPKILNLEQKQAKLLDIPVPIGFQHLYDEESSQTRLMVYEGMLSLEKTRLFYLQEMERLGWKISDLSVASEIALWCEKITKQCIISARLNPLSQKIQIHCFLKIKDVVQRKKEWFDEEE